MINFISGKYCVPPDVLSAADNHLLRGDSCNVIGWVRQRLLREWRSWREFLREGRKQLTPVLHLKKFVLVFGHVGATSPHPPAQIRQRVIDKEVSEQESLQRGGGGEQQKAAVCQSEAALITREPNSRDLTP